MSKSHLLLLSPAIAALLLATGCAGTVNEKDSATATVSAAPAESSASTSSGAATNPDGTPMTTDAAAATPAPAGSAADVTSATADETGGKPASKLLMSTEVSGLTGHGVTAMPQANGGVRYVEKKSAGDTATVAYVTYAPSTTYDDMKNAGKMAAVAGMGQGALFNAASGTLYVKSADKTLLVGVPMNLQGKDRRKVAVGLAQLALARMK